MMAPFSIRSIRPYTSRRFRSDSVTSRIGAFLLQFTTTPQFVVQPEFRIVVRGEVRNPALYIVPLETTLGGAIAAAGGPTENAQLRKVMLVRDQRAYRLDLSDPAAPWTASPIRSGDQIIIGRKSNLFFGTMLAVDDRICRRCLADKRAAALLSVAGETVPGSNARAYCTSFEHARGVSKSVHSIGLTARPDARKDLFSIRADRRWRPAPCKLI